MEFRGVGLFLIGHVTINFSTIWIRVVVSGQMIRFNFINAIIICYYEPFLIFRQPVFKYIQYNMLN